MDDAEIYEYVFPAIIRGNEAENLGLVKPLGGACGQVTFAFK
jgi:hypothetical protein